MALSAFLLMAGFILPAALYAETTHVDPPKTEEIAANTEIKVVTPTNTFYGTRGLTQTGSAEALGEGRLLFSLSGSMYQQQQAMLPLTPDKDAKIFTGIGALSFGVSPYIDLFAGLSIYGSTGYNPLPASNTGSGMGTLSGGAQGTLPFTPSTPIRMAAQVAILQGLSSNQINTYTTSAGYRGDGYNYFETRTGLDFMAKLLQTMVFGGEDMGFKLHVNEGLVSSVESGQGSLLLLATGLQFNLPIAALGLELNSRTPLKDITPSTDALWVTPSVQLRTPYSMNATLGADVSLSQARAAGIPRALEPYRLFAGMTFSFDTQAEKRRRIKEREQKEAAEKAQMKKNNEGLASDLAQSDADMATAQARQKASNDSLAALMNKSQKDSAAMADKARQDSVAMTNRARQDSVAAANKARHDSLALAESQKNLNEEKSKRSDAEKQLLSTGLLLMDAVYFETGKTEISINSKPYLNIIAKMLTKYPKLQIEVSGHTDNVGGADYNMGLSQGRSEAVRAYMATVAPELSSHLTAKGYGLTQPKASNSTADGRKHNRRTELQVLNKEALSEYNR